MQMSSASLHSYVSNSVTFFQIFLNCSWLNPWIRKVDCIDNFSQRNVFHGRCLSLLTRSKLHIFLDFKIRFVCETYNIWFLRDYGNCLWSIMTEYRDLKRQYQNGETWNFVYFQASHWPRGTVKIFCVVYSLEIVLLNS